MTATDINQLARLGAIGRLQELEAERESILRMFPDLRANRGESAKRGRGRTPAAATAPPQPTAAAPARRGPRRMSAEARKRISDAQKKRWAAQKAKKAAR